MNVRLGFFLAGLILFSLWGFLKPTIKSPQMGKLLARMSVNVAFGALGGAITNLLVPGGLFFLAGKLEEVNFGLFNQITLPYFLEFAITLLLLDLAIYAQHVLSHHWNFLWRFHKVHHGDPFFDSTTALRFHPGEILFSFLYKAILVALLGLDGVAIITFEIILNFSAMFNHGNFALPKKLEMVIKKVIVTPDFHRVHHSPVRNCTDSNYGFFFSFWDYVFNTYNQRHLDNKVFGLTKASYSGSQNLFKLIWAPAVKKES